MLRLFIVRRITLYRPQYLMRLDELGWPVYELGDLRAKLLGVRIPIHWALNQLLLMRILNVGEGSGRTSP